MSVGQFLRILRARARLVLLTLFATTALALVVSLLLPKQYTAKAAVVVDVKSPDPVGGMLLPGMITPGYMATQVDIINSDRVAQRVVRLLRLDEEPALKEEWQEDTEGRGDITAWLGTLLKRDLVVSPGLDSNVINIAWSGRDPALTAATANAFAQSYVDANLEMKVDPARQSATWFEDQTKTLRARLETAQAALSRYQQETGIVASDERMDYETSRLNDLSTQLTIVTGELADSRSKSTASGPDTMAEVIQNPLITMLKTDIARLEARLQESSSRLGDNHPQTQSSKSELASLRSRLASESQKIFGSFTTSYQVGRQKQKELTDAMAAQKARVLDLSRERDAINVLKRDVEAAQRDLESVSSRTAQARLESRSIQTNVVLLNPASEPTKPSQPRVLINVLAAAFLGVLLGVGAALVLELGNRRVRSADDLAFAIGRPVLSTIPHSAPRLPGRQLLRLGYSGTAPAIATEP